MYPPTRTKGGVFTWRVHFPTQGTDEPSQTRAPSPSMLKRTLRREGRANASPLGASSAATAPMSPWLAASQQRAGARHHRGHPPPARSSLRKPMSISAQHVVAKIAGVLASAAGALDPSTWKGGARARQSLRALTGAQARHTCAARSRSSVWSPRRHSTATCAQALGRGSDYARWSPPPA